MNIKEEPCFVDFCSQNETDICSKDILRKTEAATSDSDCNIHIKTEIEEQILESKFCSENQLKDPVIEHNNVSRNNKFKPKIEVKGEQILEEGTSTENLCISDDIEHVTAEYYYSTKTPRLNKNDDSSYKLNMLSNEDSRSSISLKKENYTPECEDARRCQSQESDVTKISPVETAICSETPDAAEIVSMTFCLEKNNFLKENKRNKQVMSMKNCEFRKEYKCDICEKSFKYSSYLKTHKLVHESKKANKCNVCEKEFKHLSSLKRHKLVHDDIQPQSYNIFKEIFTNLPNVKTHKSKKTFTCDICNKTFISSAYFKTHKLIHEGKKPHKCNMCDKAFTQLSNLKKHTFIHEGIKPHKCSLCNKGFTLLSTLKSHKLIHEGIKPHKCNMCNKTFTDLSNLRKHKLIHEGIKLHKCNICNKTFGQLITLKRHQMSHEGIKPHKCKVCDKTFTLLQHLKTHKLIHEGTKPHKCNICNKAFTDLSGVKRHKLCHEGIKPYKCNICDKTFSDVSNFRRHKLIHQEKKPD